MIGPSALFFRVRNLWSALRASMWFVPSVLVLAAVLMAFALIAVDVRAGTVPQDRLPWLFGAGADGARGMLGAIATSMITVAGVAFSITIVTLSLAATQYSSRVLRNFMRDRANQIVLGVFVGVFAYCLVVLRTIRGGDEGQFVPALAVSGGVILAFVGIGFLIFFIHHVAGAIQASQIIATVTDETLAAVDRLFPDPLGAGGGEAAAEIVEDRVAWTPMPSRATGYIQRIDVDSLLDVTRAHDLVLRMERGVGEFVIADMPLLSVAGDDPGADVLAALEAAYVIDRQRSIEQDAGFGIRQLVDVALKALSPGINDTTTAVVCIDYLTAILVRVGERSIPSPYRYDAGVLRVIARGPDFATLLADAFDQIRRTGESNLTVLARLIGALALLADVTRDPARRRALRGATAAVREAVMRAVAHGSERAAVDERAADLLRRLDALSHAGASSRAREERSA